MRCYQEITEWDTDFVMPNHVYFLSDSKDKMYAYVNKAGLVETVRTPYRFKASGRKFQEVPNTWGYKLTEEPEQSIGTQYRVPGSKGAIYTVTDDAGAWSCTCPASKWSKGSECKHIQALKTA